MKAIAFLYRKIAINNLKKALKRPIVYFWVAIVFLYLKLIFSNFGGLAEIMSIDNAGGLARLLTVGAFLLIPGNLISYCKRKGLLFRAGDVHFLFPSPIGPKKILLATHAKTLTVYLIFQIIFSIGGVLWFGRPVWQMVLYFLLSCIVENILEGSIMTILYGSESLSSRQILLIRWILYGLIGVFVLIAGAVYLTEGMSFAAVISYLDSDMLIMVPVVGWYIAVIRLIIIGPDTVNIICSLLYFLTTALMLFIAVRMKCRGSYFEDAIKFADDYEEARSKSKKGEMAFVGKKTKYKKAEVKYHGKYAKAIFYRQLLEYKKQRFFIFGPYTLLCLGLGIGIAFFAGSEDSSVFGAYIILGVMAYLTFIFSSYLGKWGKELERPYTYLIPDTAVKKLWYSTAIEHIRSLADGILLTLPGAFVMELPILQTILIIGIYVCLQACKLYCAVMVEALLGNALGRTGQQFARIFFEGIVISIGILGAVIGTLLISPEAGFLILIILSLLLTVGAMAVAALNFKRMESRG